MVRTVERLDGLAVAGRATLGPLSLRIPELILARPQGSEPQDAGSTHLLELTDRGGADPGYRRLSLGDGSASLSLELPVPTPEISGVDGFAHASGPGLWAIHWPLTDEQWQEVRSHEPEAVVLSNSRVLFGEAEPFLHAVREVRERLGAGPLLWAPRVALPHRLAILAYLGVDLVDSTETLWRAAEGEFLDADLGNLDASDARAEEMCPCLSCTAGRPVAEGGHAAWILQREFRLVRTAIRSGRLRELVEARVTTEPRLAEILRYADRILGPLLEERTPVLGTGVRGYVLRESQRRPEVRRYRERFVERYIPPPSKDVLLLVACSKTKPYRSSRSHRRLGKSLEGVANLARLHVVSVTSPLGLVPRELEDFPPAAHYDIPVTGEWDETERAAVVTALDHLLAVGHYRELIVHLDPVEYAFLRPSASDVPHRTWTLADGRTTSSEGLHALRAAAIAALARATPVPGGPLAVVREELQAIASVQLGREAARRLFADPIRLQGRPWFQRITDGGGVDLATWREERGLFQLTVPGGERLLPAHPLEVEVADGVPIAGDIFVPGISRADAGIRTGDAVLVVRSGTLLGVGEAALPGRLMTQLRRGVGVRMRHRKHAAAVVGGPTAT